MTISSTTRKAGPFTGDGLAVVFPFAFKVFTAADLLVVQTTAGVDTTKALTTDYTVALNADQNASPGGSVTMLVSPPVGSTLTLTSQVANTQGTDLTNLGGFFPKTITDALDRATIQIQQLADKLVRSLQLPLSSTASGTLPAPVASSLIGWDSLGASLMNYAGLASSAVSAAMAPVVAAATLLLARAAMGATTVGDALFTAASAAAARLTVGAAGHSAVRGLVGTVNAVTPLTKYDLQALAVTLRDANGALVTQLNTATLTCNLGLAGPAANGRDVAGAFAINTWVYLYFIWDGTTLATLASTTAPASFTGSTLPTGYTHWAFATALRWNASSNIIPAFTRGSNVTYDVNSGSTVRVLTAGVATAFTAVSLAGFVPPILLRARCAFLVAAIHTSSTEFGALIRATGSAITGGFAVADVFTPAAGVQASQINTHDITLGTNQQIDYKLTVAPVTFGGLYIDVLGYVIPNGDA